MFDKIAIIDNKIATIKWEIEWQENLPVSFSEELDGEQFRSKTRVERTVNEKDKERILQNLTKREIEYKITDIDIPESVQIYDGEEWTKGRDEALQYINGVGEYNPALIEANSLRQQLVATDYKAIKFAEGIISEAEYEEVRIQRQTLRDKINMLEQQLSEEI